MPFQLQPPVEKTFTLDKTDKLFKTKGTVVTIRQATQSAHERRNDLTSDIKSTLTDTEYTMATKFNRVEIARYEVMFTLVDCNITNADGEPLFKFKKNGDKSYLDMQDTEFAQAWGLLPPSVCAEIHEKVLEVNPTWKQMGEA